MLHGYKELFNYSRASSRLISYQTKLCSLTFAVTALSFCGRLSQCIPPTAVQFCTFAEVLPVAECVRLSRGVAATFEDDPQLSFSDLQKQQIEIFHRDIGVFFSTHRDTYSQQREHQRIPFPLRPLRSRLLLSRPGRICR